MKTNEKKVAEFLQEAMECLEEADSSDGPYTDTIETFEEAG